MKAFIVAALLLLTACESQRGGKDCIGIRNDPEPGVKYEPSIRNIVIGCIFVETVVVPAIVVVTQLRCPKVTQ